MSAPFDTPITCDDCGGVVQGYMVKDAVWAAAGLEPRGLICLVCLADRLGRELRFGDFTPAPVNPWLFDEPITRSSQRGRRQPNNPANTSAGFTLPPNSVVDTSDRSGQTLTIIGATRPEQRQRCR